MNTNSLSHALNYSRHNFHIIFIFWKSLLLFISVISTAQILILQYMDQVLTINDWRVPSAHVACRLITCDWFTNIPYWISPSKLCIGDGFPGINSAAQLSNVGYSFLVLDMKGFFLQIDIFLFKFLLLVAQWKDCIWQT